MRAGTEVGVAEQAKAVQVIAAGNGGAAFKWCAQAEDCTRIWQARHDAVWANQQMRLGCSMWSTDVCVPISNLAHCILETKATIGREGLFAPVLDHVGDGKVQFMREEHGDPIDTMNPDKMFGSLDADASGRNSVGGH